MSAGFANTAAKARACLAKAAQMPAVPLWNMGAAKLGSKTDCDALQSAIDYLTCKGKARMPFTAEDKDFLLGLYQGFFSGGLVLGAPEAAALAAQYINGRGKKLVVDAALYHTSVIVRDAAEAIKAYTRRLIETQGTIPPAVATVDPSFSNSKEGRTLVASGRSANAQGYIKTGKEDRGYLLAEQQNFRLQKANNRFVLSSQTARLKGPLLRTRWSVDDRYEFEPFAKGYITPLPISSGCTLQVPDGLSHYMTVLGIADAFDYSAEWSENWSLAGEVHTTWNYPRYR